MKRKRRDHKPPNEVRLGEFPVLSLILGDLLLYLAGALGSPNSNRILAARIMNGVLQVASGDLKRLDVPLASIPALAQHSRTDLAYFEMDQDGAFLHWPNLDVHLGWEQLQQIANSLAASKATKKARAFNIRYGKAVQALRRKAGIKAGEIRGLSEAELKCIESGQSRMSSRAVKALAKAHDVSEHNYLKMVARALEPGSQLASTTPKTRP